MLNAPCLKRMVSTLLNFQKDGHVNNVFFADNTRAAEQLRIREAAAGHKCGFVNPLASQ